MLGHSYFSLYFICIDFLLFIHKIYCSIVYFTKLFIFTFIFKFSLISGYDFLLLPFLPDNLFVLLDCNNFQDIDESDNEDSDSDHSDIDDSDNDDEICLALKHKLSLHPNYETIFINYSLYDIIEFTYTDKIYNFAFLIYLKHFYNISLNFNMFINIFKLVNYNLTNNIDGSQFIICFNIDNNKFNKNYFWNCTIQTLRRFNNDELIIKPFLLS